MRLIHLMSSLGARGDCRNVHLTELQHPALCFPTFGPPSQQVGLCPSAFRGRLFCYGSTQRTQNLWFVWSIVVLVCSYTLEEAYERHTARPKRKEQLGSHVRALASNHWWLHHNKDPLSPILPSGNNTRGAAELYFIAGVAQTHWWGRINLRNPTNSNPLKNNPTFTTTLTESGW